MQVPPSLETMSERSSHENGFGTPLAFATVFFRVARNSDSASSSAILSLSLCAAFVCVCVCVCVRTCVHVGILVAPIRRPLRLFCLFLFVQPVYVCVCICMFMCACRYAFGVLFGCSISFSLCSLCVCVYSILSLSLCAARICVYVCVSVHVYM